ncbi:MAG TPA: hypothetical protein PL033_12160 [Candidatus Brocadiia bacterium]|nr:hypothetical protein [Candidatus Brocadiia bacterium]
MTEAPAEVPVVIAQSPRPGIGKRLFRLLGRLLLFILKGIFKLIVLLAKLVWRMLKDRRKPQADEPGRLLIPEIDDDEDLAEDPFMARLKQVEISGSPRPAGAGLGKAEAEALPEAEPMDDVIETKPTKPAKPTPKESFPPPPPPPPDTPDSAPATPIHEEAITRRAAGITPHKLPAFSEKRGSDKWHPPPEVRNAPIHTFEEVESSERIELDEFPEGGELAKEAEDLLQSMDKEEEDDLFNDPVLTGTGATPPAPVEDGPGIDPFQEPVNKQVMDVGSFLKALEDSGVMAPLDNVPTDVTPTVGLRVNHFVVCETDSPEGPVVFRARILSADKDELMLCREKDDCQRANLDQGARVSLTYRSEDGRSHVVRAPVSASSGPASPWFSIQMEEARGSMGAGKDGGEKKEAAKEEPEFQFRALPKAPLPGTILTDEPLRKGRIIKLDSRGMIMRTEDNIARGKYVVQDLQCKGVVAGLELQGSVVKCRADKHPTPGFPFICEVQFAFLSAQTRKNLEQMGAQMYSAIPETI